jgi:hypothetical protein
MAKRASDEDQQANIYLKSRVQKCCAMALSDQKHHLGAPQRSPLHASMASTA